MCVNRQDMRDILVGTDDYHTALLPLDRAHVEDVTCVLQIGAEHFFVVHQPEPAFSWKQQLRHRLQCEIAETLLEDRPQIDHCIDVFP